MAFVQPNFNLSVALWHPPAVPPAVSSLVTVGNLSPGRLISMIGFAGGGAGGGVLHDPTGWLFTVLLRLPALTDVRSAWQGPAPDLVEVPTGSLRFYYVFQVDDIAKGFVNEHRLAYISPALFGDPRAWPVPYP